MLTISRIDSGKTVFKKEPLDPARIIESACKSLKLRADEKHVGLTLNLYENSMIVHADADALKQVVINLVQNAIKFTPWGGQVYVSLVREHDLMLLTVRDTGVGIPKKDLEKIFEKFYRVERAGEETEGTGLGLSIVREIVNAHGGSVEARCSVGAGATFRVRIPLFKERA